MIVQLVNDVPYYSRWYLSTWEIAGFLGVSQNVARGLIKQARQQGLVRIVKEAAGMWRVYNHERWESLTHQGFDGRRYLKKGE